MNYVIGDIQGCFGGLQKLLKKLKFEPKTDKLWAVGDLVARGPNSLETLRYLKSLGKSFDCVLGNHDLHLIAMAHGIGKPKPNDKLDELIAANDFSKLIEWLQTKPLALKIGKNHLVSHAGLYPAWSFKQAIAASDEVSTCLQSKHAKQFLKNMYGNEPNRWDQNLTGVERLRFMTNALTRMRYVQKEQLEFKHKCHPSVSPKELSPWFDIKNKHLKKEQIVLFGHWASLLGETNKAKVIGLDTGYVWGKYLSAYCVETKKIIKIS